ncbi:MAG: chemotaxis response regulator protein-glutamate methylesterase [Spirochaetales bacterium]|nr:chemotaxis response regulator protein-glutamate methylesterase [Spirochaetales bacterium]
MKKISVLICDDSALMRRLVSKIVESDPRMEVAGTAVNGKFALNKIPILKPDIVILDLEMPDMNGIEFLKERRKNNITVPVVILSSLAKKGASITMEALSLGASDFVLKPSGSISLDIEQVSNELKKLILVYGGRYKGDTTVTSSIAMGNHLANLEDDLFKRDSSEDVVSYIGKENVPPPLSPSKRPNFSRIDIVAIGISTGGPNALRKVFAALDRDFPVPIVVVQHMPEGFTAEFADSLNSICQLSVREAVDGEPLLAGSIYIAPGNHHIVVKKSGSGPIVRVNQSPQVNGHRPSADVLFKSVSQEYGGHSLGVIMTGMGRDGAKELGSIYNLGGYTIAQDQESCIVYGMPRVATEYGYVDKVVSLPNIAEIISGVVRNSRK